MKLVDSNKKFEKEAIQQQEESKKKSRIFFNEVKQEIHSNLNELLESKKFFNSLLKKNWDDLEENKVTRSILKSLNALIKQHRENCPVCDSTRWGGQNSFKEELCT